MFFFTRYNFENILTLSCLYIPSLDFLWYKNKLCELTNYVGLVLFELTDRNHKNRAYKQILICKLKTSPHRPYKFKTRANENPKILNSNAIYDIPVLANSKLLADVVFWTFSNCRILESKYEAFDKFRKHFEESLAVQIGIPAPSIELAVRSIFRHVQRILIKYFLVIFAYLWLSCKNNKQKISYLWSRKTCARPGKLIKLTGCMQIW